MRSVAMDELARLTGPVRMSQSELADELGMTPQVVSKWVHGLSSPSDDVRLKIEKILGIAPANWDKESRASQLPARKSRKQKRNPKPRKAA